MFCKPVFGLLTEGLIPTAIDMSEISCLSDIVVFCYKMSMFELFAVMCLCVLLALYVPKF